MDFVNISLVLGNSLPPPTKTFDNFMKNNRYDKTLFLSPTDYLEIESIITSLKSKKSSGHDNISSQFIKQIKRNVSKAIAIIINISMEFGIVPNMLKLSKIIPIHKPKIKNYVQITDLYLFYHVFPRY